MGVSSNRFFVTAIKDGTVINAVIYSTKSLTQLSNPNDGSSTPDWTVEDNQPTVYCATRTGATLTAPATWKWYMNDTEITFSAESVGTVSSNFGGSFVYALRTIEGIAGFPAIGIVKNISSFSNNDNNVLSCRGTIGVGSAAVAFDVSTTLRTSVLSSNTYYGWAEGYSYVTTAQPATVTVRLTHGTADVNEFHTKWYIEGVSGDTPFATRDTSVGAASVTFSRADITDHAVIRIDYYTSSSSSDKLCCAYWNIDDMEDMEEMYICSYNDAIRSGLDVSLRASQTAQFVAWMGKRGDETTIDTNYTHFYCKLLNSEGSPITSNFSGVTTPYGEISPDEEGWFEITTNISSPVTATYAGKVTVAATFADTNGGRVTGLVKATTTT